MITFNLSDPIRVRFELTCTSVGRPLNQMVWMVNGSELSNLSSYPVLSNATSGTYYSTLLINERKVGNYSCQVSSYQGIIIGEDHYLVTGKCYISI